MTSNIQQQLKTRMEARGLNSSSLEKIAGVNRSSVRNIINGLSRKPSLETLKAISEVLECSVSDLVGYEIEDKPKSLPKVRAPNHKWNYDLYLSALNEVNKQLSLYDITKDNTKLAWVTNIINEVYNYSCEQNLSEADFHFTKWLVAKSIR